MKTKFKILTALTAAALATSGASYAASESAQPPEATTLAQDAARGDVMEALTLNPEYSILVAALEQADLDDTLKGEGPFTVFAPDNAAFRKLPDGAVDDLMKDENKAKLTKVLLYHVLPGKVMAVDVKTSSAATAGGDQLALVVEGETVKVGNATVTAVDMEGTNGVIHNVDTVLMP